MSFKVGQTATSMIQMTSTKEDESGTFRPRLTSLTENSVLLKVEGSKYYQFKRIFNSSTSELRSVVVFKDAKLSAASLRNVVDVKVVGAQLKMVQSSRSIDHEQSVETVITTSKNLLSPIMCDKQVLVKSQVGADYEMMSESTLCGAVLSSAEVKAINLSQIEFCQDEAMRDCEIRDMSFLTLEK